ncbi:hypothetical protein [Sandaracinus amylolyticus]|uniref:hypothetical protein n=1 Tax=Sandaracinus amylolyticus TaxID=927083 RepID=UPI00069F3A12|nr:hypothetical protein [Sandaracinus amylolyticus]
MLLVLTVALASGCGSDAAPDGGTPPEGDSSMRDGGLDPLLDAGVDPTLDASPTGDAGNACSTDPCGDANCTPLSDGGVACCPPPLVGARCDMLDWCTTSPCMNGGACTHIDERSVRCDCVEGFVGRLCEHPDPCEASPCSNGGTCAHTEDGAFACTCPAPYVGDTCGSVDLCTTSPCLNGGTCTPEGEEGFRCACAPGFLGDTCARIDECLSNPCLNGGTCTNGVDGFTCACPPGYSGSTCLTNVDDCPTPDPCLNGGTCVDGLDDYDCDCAPSFGGDDCSVSCSGATATAVVDGDWTAPATWGGVVPSSGTFVVIPTGRTVTIPAGVTVRSVGCAGISVSGTLVNRGHLTADRVLNLRGPSPAVAATLRNEGTLVLDDGLSSTAGLAGLSVFVNAAGGTFTTRGSVTFNRLTNGGTWTIADGAAGCTSNTSCAFDSSGTVTVAAGAVLDVSVPPVQTAVSSGSLVNHGTFRTSRVFENRGIFESTGRMETIFDGEIGCSFTNGGTGTLTSSGTIDSNCPLASHGAFTNTGILDARGVMRAHGTFTNEASGVIRVAGLTELFGAFVNRGRLSAQPDGRVSIQSGTLTNHGTISVVGRFQAQEGGTLHIVAGGLLEAFEPIGNWGTYDVEGTLVVGGSRGHLNNQGTVHQRCGSTVSLSRGGESWGGNPAMVESPCP